MVEELLLGDNPFIGVSHLAQEKAKEEQREASLENKVKVIEAAVEGGATGFTFSTHPSNLELLKYLSKNSPELAKKLNYYVLVPYAARYVREASTTGTAQLIKRMFTDNLNFQSIRYVLYPTPINLIKMFLEAELKEYLSVLPNVKAVFLHEILTELIIAFNISHVIKELSKHFLEKNIYLGLETRNLKHTERFLENNDLHIRYLMTPLNPLGYQMTPTKEEVEASVKRLSSKNLKIIAINVLASGALPPDKTLDYLGKLKDDIYAITIGTSKSWRALEIFKILKNVLK